ncbi:MAG: FAD-dependent oxidoreductase, partial [Rhodospirillaceae bacterium]
MSSTPTAPAAGSRKIAIIGAGAMGLVAAYHAAKAGYDVTVYEADKKPGGMAAHFDFGGLSIERYYHFVCKADQPLFDILEEVGLGDAMVWKDTSMGYFFNGALHNWGDPISLLRFPGIGLIDKIRYGLHAFYSTKRSDWEKIDGLRADAWIKAWIGQKAYDVLWKKLFELKFYHYAENVSASWIWTRIKRVGTSRKSMMQEQLGYIEGGSETLVHRLVEKIEGMGGKIVLGAPVQEIRLSDGPNNSKKVEGVATPEGFEAFDNVISTVPMPYVGAMI